MLPPSTMRDLANLHKVLFNSETLTEGEKGKETGSKNVWDDFYS